MTDTKRETLTRLYDAAQPIGVAYLLAIITLGSMTVKELRSLTRDSEPTVNKTLGELETRGLVQRSGSGHADRWFPSPMTGLLFHQKIFGDPSSSSDQISLLNSDQDRIRSDDEEQHPKNLGANLLPEPAARDEEAEREYRIKRYLADHHYHLTGDKRRDYVEDDSIWAIDFEMWLYQIGQMKRDGVPIKHPAAYALMCCKKGDRAKPEYERFANQDLDTKLKYFLEHFDDESKGGDEHE